MEVVPEFVRADGTKSEGYVTVYRETLPFLVDQLGFEKDWQKKFWAWRDVAYPNAKERPYWYKQAEEFLGFLKEWGEHVRCERERGDGLHIWNTRNFESSLDDDIEFIRFWADGEEFIFLRMDVETPFIFLRMDRETPFIFSPGDEFLSRITDVWLFCGNNGRMLSAACGAANADRRAA